MRLTFDEWICLVFDNPPGHTSFDLLSDWGELPGEVLLEYLAELFAGADSVLAPYSDAQVGQSFWFLMGLGGEAGHEMMNPTLPWLSRQRCIRAVFDLFERCFAPRCDPVLSHGLQVEVNPLNSPCYMWWDVFPTWGSPGDPAQADVDAELLAVMERTLILESEACRESALHGLGHWGLNYSKQAARIIDAFLDTMKMTPELRLYAESARVGCIQ